MSNIATVFQVLSIVSLSAFSGAFVFIAVAIVKFWQSTAPDQFLAWMSDNFWRLPTIMVPLNMISLLLLIMAMATSWQPHPHSRLPLGLGLVCLLICTITFPIYFAGANAEFVTHSISLTAVASKIETWSNWHLFRTSLTILSIGCVSWSLLNSIEPTSSN